jgi:hypothetical protein
MTSGPKVSKQAKRGDEMLSMAQRRKNGLGTARRGRKPPFVAVKRPARPYKTAVENRFTMGNARVA